MVGVMGATAFTGRELVGILLQHPRVELTWLCSASQAGQSYVSIYPQFLGKLSREVDALKKYDAVKESKPDVVFSCLPHAHSAEYLKPFIGNGHTAVVDLSADFRFDSLPVYESVYATTHPYPDSVPQAVYGLTELNRERMAKSKLVGNPGCYPTSVLLPLIPLLRAGLISESSPIIADSKSGVSGAGRTPTESTHFVQANESVSAYKIGDQHRHLFEMTEQLKNFSKKEPGLLFTPHLIPMERGILSTLYLELAPGKTSGEAMICLKETYDGEAFVHVVEQPPRTADVTRSNRCHIYGYGLKGGRRLILVSVLDNLVKGASGQAVQNMNVMLGWEETTALF